MLNSILYLFINLTIFDVIIKSNLDILTTKADRGNNAELIPSCTTVQRIKNCGPALTPLSLNPFVKTYDALLLNTLTLFYHFRTVFCLFIIFLKFINVPFFRLANPVPGLGQRAFYLLIWDPFRNLSTHSKRLMSFDVLITCNFYRIPRCMSRSQ